MHYRAFAMHKFVLGSCLLICGGCSHGLAGKEDGKQVTPTTPASAQASGGEKGTVTQDGFTPLGLDDFEIFQGKARPNPPTWSEEGHIIKSTGKPRGYLYSKKPYRNFTLRADLRYPPEAPDAATKANTGFLMYIAPPHRVWPICIEVQGKQIELAMIKGNGKPNPLDPAKVHDDESARQKARRPIGEWNAIEIVSSDGKLTSFVNGVKISENEPVELREGPIGLQAEDFPYEIRNLRVRE